VIDSEVIGRRDVRSQSAVRELGSSVFSCGVLISGQRKLKKWPFVNQNQVSHSGREDTRSPVRNEASLSH
jgi:hypothetical protein